jgi:hypothetical protein
MNSCSACRRRTRHAAFDTLLGIANRTAPAPYHVLIPSALPRGNDSYDDGALFQRRDLSGRSSWLAGGPYSSRTDATFQPSKRLWPGIAVPSTVSLPTTPWNERPPLLITKAFSMTTPARWRRQQPDLPTRAEAIRWMGHGWRVEDAHGNLMFDGHAA